MTAVFFAAVIFDFLQAILTNYLFAVYPLPKKVKIG